MIFRKLHTFFIGITGLILIFCSCQPDDRPSADTGLFSNKYERSSKQQRIEERHEQEYIWTHDPDLRSIPTERVLSAREYMKKFRVRRSSATQINWEERGPNNVGGRTRGLIFDRNDPTYSSAFAAGVSGGLWYTDNIYSSSTNWQPVNDFFGQIAITTIAQDENRPDTIYFGTGEGFFNIDAVRGLGIWRSTDGGISWDSLPSTQNSKFHYVNKLVITDQGYVLAATRSSSGGNGGLYRSVDFGTSWTRVLSGSQGDPRAADIEIAANGDIYASMGLFQRDGIYKSTDDGATWTQVYEAQNNEKRIELACAPGNASVVYALVQKDNGDEVPRIYKTINAGADWVSLPTPQWNDQGFPCSNTVDDWSRGQDWYNLIALVHPDDADKVIIGGIDLFRTDDGGQNWEQISHWTGNCFDYVHADHHALAIHPENPNIVLSGNDGGVHLTQDWGDSWSERNDDYNVTQFYSCALHPDVNSHYMLGGTQDNGTRKFTDPGMNATSSATGGDGGFCHIDQTDPSIQFTSYTGNTFIRSTNGGNNFLFVIGTVGSYFINPSDYDDLGNDMYASAPFSTYLRWNDAVSSGADSAFFIEVPEFNDLNPTAIAVSPNVPNRVYFGFTNGRIVYVDDADKGLIRNGIVIREGGSTSNISSIAIEKGNEDHLLITISNYGRTSIYESVDGGANWVNVEGNFSPPDVDIPVRWGMFNPNDAREALIATELGVWSTDRLDGSNTLWVPTNAGLANVRCDMFQLRESDNLLSVATHGRGIFTTNDLDLGYRVFSVENRKVSCDGNDVSFDIEVVNTGTPNLPGTVSLGLLDIPNGLSHYFSTAEVDQAGLSVLTLEDVSQLGLGTYKMRVFGAHGTDTVFYTLTLIVDAIPDAPLVVAPNSGDTSELAPEFEWEPVENLDYYALRLATDNGFTDIIYRDTLYEGSGTKLNELLEPNSLYFWQIRVKTICGLSPWSNVTAFVTGSTGCIEFVAEDVPVTLPESGFAHSYIHVIDTGTVVDVDVRNLSIDHTFIGDLVISLVSPPGDSVLLVENICSFRNDMAISFDDNSNRSYSSIPCPPTSGLTYRSLESLSTVHGADAGGFWELLIEDNAVNDDGELLGWSIKLCIEQQGAASGPGPCSDTLTVSGNISEGVYKADQLIRTSGSSEVVGNVILRSGQTIELNAGFSVMPGAVFEAKIAPCGAAPPPEPPVIRALKRGIE